MRQSLLFSQTSKQAPHGATSANHRLLVMGGFIDQLMAGVFTYLPLGFRVFNRINDIIRSELNALGAEELYMPALHPKSIWTTTGRWESAASVMYQFTDTSGNAYALGWTHEEVITHIAKRFIHSYRNLPHAVYQIQDKFRNEPRAKSGLIRGREFAMKDLYSFHADTNDLDTFYEKVLVAYTNIFRRCGLEAKIVEASGGEFTKQYSHEFQVIADSGEDSIVYCTECSWAQNSELVAEKGTKKCANGHTALKTAKSIEVGNTFKLGTRFSEADKLFFQDSEGRMQPVVMASYGIGPGRVLGTVVEVHHDEKGIVWPASIAPFYVHLVSLAQDDATRKSADAWYEWLTENSIPTLYDDRDVKAGEKFADADLLGMPVRLVVSEKTEKAKGVEWKMRTEKTPSSLSASEARKQLIAKHQAEYI